IGSVNTIDAGSLHDHIGTDFNPAQNRGSIGREVRISGSGPKDDDAPFFKVTDRAALDVRLGNRFDFKRSLQTREHPLVFQSALQRHSVDYRREHSHVIALNAIDALSGTGNTSKNVTSANYDGNLDTTFVNLLDFVGIL